MNNTKIYVAGHRGMVGSAIVRQLQARGCTNIVTRTHAELDLTHQAAVNVGDVLVRIDPRYFRPTEVETLLGDPSKAKEKLGWVPEITVQEMCKKMVAEDLKAAKRHALLKQHGHLVPVAVEN